MARQETGAPAVCTDPPPLDMTHVSPATGRDERELADLPRLIAALPRRISDIPRLGLIDPAAEAIRHGTRSWTFAAFADTADAVARGLADAGVRGGDRVLIVGENAPELLALLFGAARLDAWAVIVNARLSAREVDFIAAHCEPRRSVFTVDVSPEAAAHAARCGAGERLAIPGMGNVLMTPRNDQCRPEPVHEDPAKQVAALIYTSGTTGDPKGVMLTHRNLLFIARLSSTLRNLRSDDRVYAVLPISHVYGLASVSLGTLFGGACLELETRFAPQAMLAALMDNGGVTMLQGVPSMYAKLVDFIEASGHGMKSPRLRACFAGGSPLDASLKAKVERVLGVTLHNGYGLTEAAPTIAHTRLDAPRTDCSVGRVLPGVELRIVDPRDVARRDVAAGEPGELWVRGPNVMRGYYKNDALTARTINSEGWLNTGDLARCEPDGTLFIVGRTKELIIRSGFNVYPPEVEAVLNSHPAITHSAVVGRAVPGNEEVIAFVELRPQASATTAEIAAYLRPLLAPYKQPAEIRIVPTLPVAANGKVLKHRLADLAKQTCV
jgi:long-chain acyl-CoA synthetase